MQTKDIHICKQFTIHVHAFKYNAGPLFMLQTMNNTTIPQRGLPVFTGTWFLQTDIITLIVLTCIAVMGLANVGVILCFVWSKTMRKPYNYIVLGM